MKYKTLVAALGACFWSSFKPQILQLRLLLAVGWIEILLKYKIANQKKKEKKKERKPPVMFSILSWYDVF